MNLVRPVAQALLKIIVNPVAQTLLQVLIALLVVRLEDIVNLALLLAALVFLANLALLAALALLEIIVNLVTPARHLVRLARQVVLLEVTVSLALLLVQVVLL